MNITDLTTTSITEVSRLLKNRELSPVELIEATLEQIDRWNPRLNIYTTVCADYALSRAQKGESEISKGQYRGVLHGIPYSLKDLIDTEGIRTTYGYQSHQDYVPQKSATVHRRLEDSGAILVGKTVCHFRRRSKVPVPCFNPWDPKRSPGVSSAGSGAAVAVSAGLFSIGSDTGSSVRVPAAWTGVVGLRATLGLISRHNALGPSWSLDQVGPMGKTVRDVASVLQAVAGYDPEDPITFRVSADYQEILEKGIEGIRIGVLEELLGEECDEEVETAVRKALTLLEDLGADTTSVLIPHMSEAQRIGTAISDPESAVAYAEVFPKERLDNIDPDMKEYLEEAATHTMAEYLQGQRMAAVLRQEIAEVFNEVDIIVSPTALTPPLLISETISTTKVKGREVNSPGLFSKSTSIASVAGLPALSVPCGFTKTSLPIGLQLMGRRLEEPFVLQVGHIYEQATQWHLRHPELE